MPGGLTGSPLGGAVQIGVAWGHDGQWLALRSFADFRKLVIPLPPAIEAGVTLGLDARLSLSGIRFDHADAIPLQLIAADKVLLL